MSLQRKLITLLASVFAVIVAVTAISLGLEIGADNQAPHYHDFIQYWTAARVMADGINPYNPHAMFAIQKLYSPTIVEPTMMWLPPWAVVLMSPWLILPLEISARTWLVTNIAFWFLAGAMLARLYLSKEVSIVKLGLITFCFPPCMFVLMMGQVSIFCLLGVVLTLIGYSDRRYWQVGVGIAMASIKPHLAFLWIGAMLFNELVARRYRALVAMCAPLLLVILATKLIFPAAPLSWLLAREKSGIVADVTQWSPSTAVGWLRAWILHSTGNLPTWPMFVLPGIAMLAVGYWLLRTRPSKETLVGAAPILLCASLFLGPYGWYWDHAVLLPVQFLIVGIALSNRRYLPILVLGVFHLIVLTVIHVVPNSTFELALNPPLLLLLCLWSLQMCRRDPVTCEAIAR